MTEPTTLNFSQALHALKIGHRIARTRWNGKNMFLFLVQGSVFTVNRPPLNQIYEEGTLVVYQPHIDMKTAEGTIVPWLASQSDVLADDWVIHGKQPVVESVPTPKDTKETKDED